MITYKFADTKASLPAHDSNLAKMVISEFLETTVMNNCLKNEGLLILIKCFA